MEIANVAVVVPLRNRAQIVLHTLDSVADGQVLPRKLIVVDDGSTDDSSRSVSRWMSDHDHLPSDLILQCESHRGASAARNKGLQLASNCCYVAFLDSDDRWPTDFLARAVAALDGDPTAVAATADRYLERAGGRRNKLNSSRAIARNATEWLLLNDGGIGSCTLFRSKLIRELGGYEESLQSGHDTRLFLPLSTLGSWLHLPGAPVCFAIGHAAANGEAGNLSRSLSNRAQIRAELRQQFVLAEGGLKHVSEQAVRRSLTRRWYRAGREAHDAGHHDRAHLFYQQALHWNRFYLRARMHKLRLEMSHRSRTVAPLSSPQALPATEAFVPPATKPAA